MKKLALPLVFLVVTGVAACSSNAKSTTPLAPGSTAVSSVQNSAGSKTMVCSTGASLEKLIQTSPNMVLKPAKDDLSNIKYVSQEIQNNVKPLFQDVVDGKTSGPEFAKDLSKAKTFCGSAWRIPA